MSARDADPFDAHPGDWFDEDPDGDFLDGLDGLDRLDVAVGTAWDMVVQMEAAIDKAVREAVRAGHSWGEVGERLGLTEQEARQEYERAWILLHEAPPGVERSAELEAALTAAHRATVEGRAPDVDTDHLLEGLSATDGIAAAVLSGLWVTRERVREAWLSIADPRPAPLLVPGYSAPAKTAVAAAELHAVETAADGAPVVVGTHHLLAVLLADPMSRACLVLAELDVTPREVGRALSAHVPRPRNFMGRRFRYGPRPPDAGA